MRVERLRPGSPVPAELAGAVLARDLVVDGERWSKGRRLSRADLDALASASPGTPPGAVTVLVLEPGDVHEDEAAVRLALAVSGPGLTVRGPAESRVDLLAAADGVLHVRAAVLERINRLDPVEVFTRFDGSIVSAGDLVGSVKVAPHVVQEAVLADVERIARRGAAVIRIAAFRARRVAIVVKESIRAPARERFEGSVRAKVESLGSTVMSIEYVSDEEATVAAALERAAAAADLVLTAGGGSAP